MNHASVDQERVFKALAHGARYVDEIRSATSLPRSPVERALVRLRDAGRITRTYSPNGRHRTQYRVVRGECLLAELWSGVR